MSHDDDLTCRCVADHRPPYLELELHHVMPIFLGGLKDGELVAICNTTHSAVHELLRLMLRAGRALTYGECQAVQERPVARYAHNLALRGYTAWLSRPGTIVVT